MISELCYWLQKTFFASICIQRYEIFHEIPNSGGDFSTNGPEKGFRGRVAALRGRFPGPQPGEGQRVQRRGTGTGRGFCGGAGAGPARSAARDRAVQVVLRWSPGHKKTDLGPFTSISATLLCYSTGFCSGMLVRYTLPHDNGSALREPVSFAGDFRQHVLLQQPVCLRFRSARRSGSQP